MITLEFFNKEGDGFFCKARNIPAAIEEIEQAGLRRQAWLVGIEMSNAVLEVEWHDDGGCEAHGDLGGDDIRVEAKNEAALLWAVDAAIDGILEQYRAEAA